MVDAFGVCFIRKDDSFCRKRWMSMAFVEIDPKRNYSETPLTPGIVTPNLNFAQPSMQIGPPISAFQGNVTIPNLLHYLGANLPNMDPQLYQMQPNFLQAVINTTPEGLLRATGTDVKLEGFHYISTL